MNRPWNANQRPTEATRECVRVDWRSFRSILLFFPVGKKIVGLFFPFFGPLLCSGRGCRVRRRPVSAAAFEGRGRRPSTARPSTVHRRRWGGGLKEKMRPTDQSGVALEWFEFERTFMGVPDWFSTGRSPIRSLARHGG